MRLPIAMGAVAAFLSLAACGADPAPGPVEQIIVREPADAAAAASAPGGTASEAADRLLAEGQAVFASCSACHNAQKGAAHGVGPNLYGIVGRPAGSAEGFAYSEALTASGIVWSPAELDRFIANPSATVPGTTMLAGALAAPEQRRAVIAYIAATAAR